MDGLQVSPFTPKKYCASSRKQEHALWPYGFSRRQTYVPNSETYHGLALSFMGYVRDLTASPWVIFQNNPKQLTEDELSYKYHFMKRDNPKPSEEKIVVHYEWESAGILSNCPLAQHIRGRGFKKIHV